MSHTLLLILFVIMLIFSVVTKGKIRKELYWVLLPIIVFIVTVRPDVMPDYRDYVNAFTFGSDRFEPFYQVLISVYHDLKFEPIIFMLTMALLTVSIKLGAIYKMSTLPIFSVLIWLSDMIVLQDMIAIRAALASSFLFWVIYFKQNGKLLYSLLACFAAYMCHNSAIVLFLVPLFSTKNSNKKLFVGALLVAMVLAKVGFAITNYFGFLTSDNFEKLASIYENQSSANAFNLLVIARCLICFFLWYNIDKIRSINKYTPLLLKAYTFGCIMFFLCSKLVSVAFRFGELFWITEIILYPYLVYCFPKNIRLGKIVTILCATALFFINYSNSFYWTGAR